MILALRDASSYNYPSQDGRIVYHVALVDGATLVAACNKWVALCEFTHQHQTVVTPGLVCRRPACWNRYQTERTTYDQAE